MEVRYLGVWGTICSNYWDLDDADVICKLVDGHCRTNRFCEGFVCAIFISAVILLLESTLIIGGQIIADYCGLNNCQLSNYWVEKYVVCPVTCYNLRTYVLLQV